MAQLNKTLFELSSQETIGFFNIRRRIQSHRRTSEFRWKAADFIAKNVSPMGTSTAIQCNILDGTKPYECNEKNVCVFCKCVLADTCHSRLLPRKVPGRKLKNLLRRAQASSYTNESIHFSKFELSLLKKCKSKPANTLIKACSVCHKSRKYPMPPWPRVLKASKPVTQSKETKRKAEKLEAKKKINHSASLQLHSTTKPESQKANLNKKKTLSMTAPPGKTKSVAKIFPSQQKINNNKSLGKLKGKVTKNKGTPEFIKKFKKGEKLAGLIAQDEALKLKAKINPKSNIFALLHGWKGK